MSAPEDREPQPQFASDHLMIALLDRSRDCVKILGIEGTLDFMHCGGADVFEQHQFEGARGQLWWSLWPEHTQATVKAAFEKASMGKETQIHAACPTAQGNLQSWTVILKPMITLDGNVAGVVCTSRDKVS